MSSQPLLSYVCGATDQPLIYRTIGGVLEHAACQWPTNPALIVRHQGVRWSYAELARRVDEAARGLLAAGLRRGDRVGIWAPNRAEWIITQFATAKLGLIQVNINPSYRSTELAYALQQVGCSALIFAPSFKTSDYVQMIRDVVPEVADAVDGRLTSRRLPNLKLLVRFGAESSPAFLAFDDLVDGGRQVSLAELDRCASSLDPDDPINIQFTSGTTGLPKGATLTHFNIVNNGCFIGQALRLGPSDRLCIPVPLYHCFGMVAGVLACATHGSCMVFPGESFDPEQVLATVAEERCTALHGVPTMFIEELEHPRFAQFDLSSLRTGIMAGAPCPVAIMRRVIKQMHMHEVTICYGMTETSPVSFQTHADDELDKRVSTVGRIHPHVQVKLVDAEGKVVPVGSPGEVCTRGYSVMRGYWGDRAKTAEAVDEAGWMHTGDLGVIDADGYCQIVGRVKDMIIRGGENVYPREIEEFLHQHPKVLDVAVVGVPDHRYGEEICAVVRLRDGMTADPAEIKDFCRERIAHYKIPKYVQFVTSFPMTVTGKIQKFALREMVRELTREAIAD